MLRRISIIVGLIALVMSVFLFGVHYGFDQRGLVEAIGKVSFGAGGPRTYEELSRRYLLISCFLSFYLIGKIIKSKLISQIICISFLSFAIYQFWQIYDFYMMLINQFHDYDKTAHFSLLRDSNFLVWLCFVMVLSLLVIQIITASKYLLNKNKATLK